MSLMKRSFLIMDANTFIDFLECDRTVIQLVCTYIGQLCVARPVLDEVRQIDESGCIELGITIMEPTIEQITISTGKGGPLSFQDYLCLTLAKDNGWTCVTNDKILRRECEAERIPLIWGIELICILTEAGGLSITYSKDIILKIHQNNPRYITEEIVRRAFERLDK